MKTVLSCIVLSLAIVAGASSRPGSWQGSNGQTDSFPDVPESHWAVETIPPISPGLTLSEASAFYLSKAKVSAELRLNVPQVKKLLLARDSYSHSQQALFRTGKATPKAIEAVDAKYADAQLKILTPGQRNRLKQVAVQQMGPIVLLKPAVGKQIGLSPAQAKKIKGLFDAMDKKRVDVGAAAAAKVQSLTPPRSPAERKDFEKKRLALYHSYDAQRAQLDREEETTKTTALKVLTPAQRKKWDALAGAPLKL